MAKLKPATIGDFVSSNLTTEHGAPVSITSYKTEGYGDEDEVRCSHCEQFSKVKEWHTLEDAIACQACGTHDALICPKCSEAIDTINQSLIIKKIYDYE